MSLLELPDELALEIFVYLDAKTLLACSRVSRRWYQVTHSQSLWKDLVLNKWPSQHWLYSKVPVQCLNWALIYKEFTTDQWYTADEMKYFTFSSTIEHEPVAAPLRQAMLEKIEAVKKKWTKFEIQDHNPNMISRYFNQNMELMFNTDTINWEFLDKRRDYLDEIFKKKKSDEKCYVRPYQVVPSCLVMYRWLYMFGSLAQSGADQGLTFYRIWRFRLKHIETGLVFELCDWKAAMSSTFSNGKPMIRTFLRDAVELLQVISHPHFIMHPLGLHPRIEKSFNYTIRASAGGSIMRRKIQKRRKRGRRSPDVSPTVNEEFVFGNREYQFPDIDEKLEQWRDRRRMALMPPQHLSQNISGSTSSCSYATSDTETEEKEINSSDCDSEFNGYEYGYVTNCEYYISDAPSYDSIEQQHSLQASISDNWRYSQDKGTENVTVLFDIEDESWYFQSEKENKYSLNLKCPSTSQTEEDILGNAVQKLHLQIPNERFVPIPNTLTPSLYFDYHSNIVEPIPSALALYRLVCLFEVNTDMYYSNDDASVWDLTMQHKKTGGLINFLDYNGMFQVYVSTIEISVPENIEPDEDENNVIVDIDTLLTEFRTAVTQLLDLLMSEDFCHPYGTIAGAVA